MGEIEINYGEQTIIIHSDIHLYGDAASENLAKEFSEEIETMWNEVEGFISLDERNYNLRFRIIPYYSPQLSAEEVISNTNPRNNYFRVENFSPINISWVDGLGSNTGYMLIDNLYLGSTTAAHEYGHTLGLAHPQNLILIGKGRPGIMYPRGTLVDPEFQYDPNKQPGEVGGTIHPIHRRVNLEDIENLGLEKLIYQKKNYIGNFSSVFHPKHVKPI